MGNESNINIKPLLLWSAGIFTAMVLVSIYAWFALPADAHIAVHWGLDGRADGWASKTYGLSVLPVMEAVILGISLLYLKYMPRRQNIGKSFGAISIVILASLAMISAGQLCIVLNALGVTVDVTGVAQILVGIVYIVIGNYMGKIRSNFMAGIRTPWTLSSELSWDKTNRLGGKLFVTAGIILIMGKWMNDMLL